MAPRQLGALFGYSLVIWSLGNGILPLLPLIAESLGADVVVVGVYLSLSYAAIALGSFVAGWIADSTSHRRRLMLAVGAAGPPFVIATTWVTNVVELLALTAVVWFLGGMALSLASIVAGLSAGPQQRGAVLGTLALAAPLGSILGGIGVGVIADAVGYASMWTVLGLLWFLCPLVGLAVQDVTTPAAVKPPRAAESGVLGAGFLLFLACALLASVGSFIGGLGRSLVMGDLHFSATDITSTVAISGLVTLPFTVLLGVLSDILGRLRFLALCYLAGLLGLVVYSTATSLTGFYVASALTAFLAYVATGLGSALVVDLVDRPALGRGMAVFSAATWTGGIVGFLVGGYGFAFFGALATFLFGAVLVAGALGLLLPVARIVRRRPARASEAVGPAPEPRKA